MFAAGQRMKRRSARIARYLAVMGERGYISVEELCTVTGKSRKRSRVTLTTWSKRACSARART